MKNLRHQKFSKLVLKAVVLMWQDKVGILKTSLNEADAERERIEARIKAAPPNSHTLRKRKRRLEKIKQQTDRILEDIAKIERQILDTTIQTLSKRICTTKI